MSNKKVAHRYTLALLELTEEMKVTAKVVKDFTDLVKSIDRSRDLKLMLKTPVISSSKKAKVLEALLKGKVQDLTFKFIMLLVKKERVNILHDIAKDFIDLMNERHGIVEAKIKTATEVSEKDKKKLVERLSQFTGKEVQAEFAIDKAIKGGFVAQVKDSIIDASIARQLQLLREQLTKGTFNN